MLTQCILTRLFYELIMLKSEYPPATHLNDLLNNETPLLVTYMHFITN